MADMTHRPPATPIVALDVPSMAEARELVAHLGDACDFYKVGLELFTAEGPPVVQWLRAAGKEIFLDLKLHDIPNTVGKAVESLAALQPATGNHEREYVGPVIATAVWRNSRRASKLAHDAHERCL